MTLNSETTVREIVVASPDATRVLEKWGIDYCCGGQKSLRAACSSAGARVEEVIHSLQQIGDTAMPETTTEKWQAAPLKDLISHIVSTHHVFTRDELGRLTGLMAKVCGVHGMNHPELLDLRILFERLNEDLLDHMHKEEQILFPALTSLEEAVNNDRAIPQPFFGSVQNPIRLMNQEHESAGDALHEMRNLSSNYTVPPDGCMSFQTLYRALDGLEKDLHQHIHLENNILFPKSIELEQHGK